MHYFLDSAGCWFSGAGSRTNVVEEINGTSPGPGPAARARTGLHLLPMIFASTGSDGFASSHLPYSIGSQKNRRRGVKVVYPQAESQREGIVTPLAAPMHLRAQAKW